MRGAYRQSIIPFRYTTLSPCSAGLGDFSDSGLPPLPDLVSVFPSGTEPEASEGGPFSFPGLFWLWLFGLRAGTSVFAFTTRAVLA